MTYTIVEARTSTRTTTIVSSADLSFKYAAHRRWTKFAISCILFPVFSRMTVSSPKISYFWTAILFAHLISAALGQNEFQLRVKGLAAGGQISNDFVLNQFGCNGKNLSPEINWSGAAPGTKSFALVVSDSDAPKKGGFYHWVILNIPSSTHSLPLGAGDIKKGLAPAGAIQLKNDYGDSGYGGPCPPAHEVHHYHFVIYALRVERLSVDQNTAAGGAVGRFQNDVLAKAEVVGTYSR
jgi:Raf kinase inhibitor-like YbhB/YbcL family protein